MATNFNNKEQCLIGIVRDLICDIRFSRRKIGTRFWNHAEMLYLRLCEIQVTALFRKRHSVKLDRYGWPQLKEFKADFDYE